MRIRIGLLISLLTVISNIYGQDNSVQIKGEVTFLTSQNIYVKFENTDRINIGDTLRIAGNDSPCLLVNSKSSRSLVCSVVDECEVLKGDEIIYNLPTEAINSKENDYGLVVYDETDTYAEYSDTGIDTSQINDQKKAETQLKEEIRGRISVSSYNIFSSIRDNRYRFSSRFSFNVNNIRNSKFSFSSYFAYRQNFIPNEGNSTRETIFFNAYDLALRYDITPTLVMVLGRKINRKMSSIGPIDGLQIEKQFGKNYIGAIVGSRPDFVDYNFNPDLFQYGMFYGRMSNSRNFSSLTTIGAIEQRNSGAIDRRFLYFQHSSTIVKKLNLFASFEIDLYSKIDSVESNDFRLTNLYASAKYRFSRKFDVMVSYDNRKRIIYYETFQTQLERLLDNDIARQGVRAGIHFKPINYLNIGINFSKRFQSDKENKSDNINGYISYSNIPGVNGRISVSYNHNTSNYLNSNALSLIYSMMLIKNKLGADFYYRYVKYDYFNSESSLSNPTPAQNYFGTNLSYYFKKRFTFSVNAEFSEINNENNYRLYIKLAKRFSNKRK